MQTVLITGGAGFIGSNFIPYFVGNNKKFKVINLDLFSEETPYAPNSPYSASKASSDFMVRSYFHTYGMNVITTNCSNNYGPK